MNQIKQSIIEEYWLKKLEGELPVISLLSNRNLKNEKTAGLFSQEIPGSTAEKMFKMANNSDPGLFTLAMANLNILLYRYTGIEDLVTGTLYPEQYGNTGNILFCRNRLDGNITLKDFIMQMGREVQETFKFGAYGFTDMSKALQLKKGKNISEIFSFAFIYDKFQNKKQSVDRFDVVIILTTVKDGLGLEVIYNPV
ncbi:MAG TPA: condensation domain-containing protein [Candidatus Kapabacteria bacterium]|nr:condensation domain-containing protein [Candidatus Kapabacteria bacterium]